MAKPVASSTESPAPPRVRFGLTVGKKMARRSVDRVLVKRILREAARHKSPEIEAAASGRFDVVLRLKAPLPARESITRTALKRALRADADTLLNRFRERLAAQPPSR
jgi:ribonuclease P protein component